MHTDPSESKKLMKQIITLVTILTLALAGGCSSTLSRGSDVEGAGISQLSTSKTDVPAELRLIERNIEQGRARKAGKLVDKWIKKNSESEFMDFALFLKGQALFARKLYYQSFLAYDELLDKYPASTFFSKALYRQADIARLFLSGAKRKIWKFIPINAQTEAISILERIAERWPGSELAATSLMMKADHHFEKEQFLEAQSSYQMVIDSYKNVYNDIADRSAAETPGKGAPPVSYYEQALLGCAKATHNQYRGPDYDTGCLSDAIIRYEQYKLSFPEKARRSGIDQQIALIRQQQAGKEFEIADYYHRTHSSDVARYYWNIIRQGWPETEWAQKAQQKLDESKQN